MTFCQTALNYEGWAKSIPFALVFKLACIKIVPKWKIGYRWIWKTYFFGFWLFFTLFFVCLIPMKIWHKKKIRLFWRKFSKFRQNNAVLLLQLLVKFHFNHISNTLRVTSIRWFSLVFGGKAYMAHNQFYRVFIICK